MKERQAIAVLSPGTGERLGEVRDSTPGDVAQAVAAARAAQPAWVALGIARRAELLRALAARIRDDGTVVATLAAESGKPRFEAECIEVFYTLELTRFFTSRKGRRVLAEEVRRPFLFAHKRARVVWKPHGVVGVIGPWNWPLLNNYADAVAPLLAGNTVVLKPSEVTPLTSLRVAELARDAGFPPGVLAVVTGGGEAGRALVAEADMIFFTGGQAAGRAIAVAAAERLIPVVLELGGKSAMIVCADADLDAAARAAVWSAFAHCGQVCIRTERVYVEDSVAAVFEARVAEETARLRLGPKEGSAYEFDVGAMTVERQVEVALGQIADAVAKGARLLTGGVRPADGRPGRWLAPAVLAGATGDMAVMREETFGPLLPIQRVRDAEEAVALANLLPFGLSGSIWSRDRGRARALARRLETGNACVNDVLVHYFCVEAPLGGIKQSGLGFRHGAEALRQFCRPETIVEDHPILGLLTPLVSRHLSFPYRERTRRLLRRVMRWLY